MLRNLLALLLTAFCSASFAQNTQLPVEVHHVGDDPVGRSFAFELRDAVRGSNSFRLVDGDAQRVRIVVNIVSVADVQTQSASAIAVATVVDGQAIPVNGLFVDAQVLYLGRSKTRQQATEMLGSIDRSADYLRSKWPAVYKMLSGSTGQ
jgi:hypothetical protein